MGGSVSVVHRDGSYVLAGYSPTDTGPRILGGWARRTPDSLPDDELGALVLEGLAAGADVLPYPPEAELRLTGPQLKHLLKVAGVRSYKQYLTGAIGVSVREVDGGLIVSAQANMGRWFGPAGFEVGAEPRDPVTVGRAVRDAFRHAR